VNTKADFDRLKAIRQTAEQGTMVPPDDVLFLLDYCAAELHRQGILFAESNADNMKRQAEHYKWMIKRIKPPVPEPENLAFTDGYISERGMLALRDYRTWDVIFKFPDTDEGYEQRDQWMDEHEYQLVPWE